MRHASGYRVFPAHSVRALTAFLLAVPAVTQHAHADEPLLDAIRAAFERQAEALESISIDFTISVRTHTRGPNGEQSSFTREAECVYRAAGRNWFERTVDTRVSPGVETAHTTLQTESSCMVLRAPSGRHAQLMIDDPDHWLENNAEAQRLFHPRFEFCAPVRAIQVACGSVQQLAKARDFHREHSKIELKSLEAEDGSTLVRARWVSWRTGSRHTLWLEPALGYAVRRYEHSMHSAHGPKAAVTAVYEYDDFQDAGGGRYFPRTVRVVQRASNERGLFHESEEIARAARIAVNTPVPAHYFEPMEVEPGVVVWDRRSGKVRAVQAAWE